jgi:hypothetical protein
MKCGTRKGLQDIRTRGSLTSEMDNPQRKFLRVASLELKKSLCRKVRDAAKKRAEEMDGKIAELDDEKTRLLAANRLSPPGETECTPASPPVSEVGPSPTQGFALKY